MVLRRHQGANGKAQHREVGAQPVYKSLTRNTAELVEPPVMNSQLFNQLQNISKGCLGNSQDDPVCVLVNVSGIYQDCVIPGQLLRKVIPCQRVYLVEDILFDNA